MPDRIKIIQSLAGAPFGGAENFYTRLVCALAKNPQLEQYAFTRKNSYRVDQLKAANVPVTTFRFGGRLDLLDHLRYRREIKKLNPDIVVTYMSRPTFVTPKGDYILVARLGHYYNLKYYRHCDYWIGNIKGICEYLIAGGMPENRVVHIPNFIEEIEAQPLTRSSFDTPVDKPLIVAAGRLHPNKAFDVLLKAMPLVPDAILWLAGDGPEQSKLKSLCKKLGLENRVRFLGWRTDVGALMRTADLFVCPSRHEGLGSIVLESWFHRCPIVSTLSQGPGELIDDGRTGILTPIDDETALAEAMNRVLQDQQLAAELRENAESEYFHHFSEEIIARKYAEFYREIKARGKT